MAIVKKNQYNKEHPEEAEFRGESTRTLVILDDVASEEDLRHDSHVGALGALTTQGRHSDIMLITSSQHRTALHPLSRDNTDLLVCMRQINQTTVELIHKEFMGNLNINTAKDMIKMYTRAFDVDTEQEQRYNFCIDTNPARTENDRYFCSTPVKPPPFMMGSFHFRSKNLTSKQREEINDAEFRAKRSAPAYSGNQEDAHLALVKKYVH